MEARIVTALGQILVDMPYASYNQGAHSTLSPASIKLRQSQIERFHELTRCINTALPLPESLSVERPGILLDKIFEKICESSLFFDSPLISC